MPRKIIKKKPLADKSRYYIDHAEYTKEVISFKKTEKASERLGELWKTHVDKCGSASCFKGYTYLDEMKGTAILFLMKYSKSFNPEKQLASGKVPNAFSYCTTIIHHAFLQVINKEKKHSAIKDRLIKAQHKMFYNLNQMAAFQNNDSDLDD